MGRSKNKVNRKNVSSSKEPISIEPQRDSIERSADSPQEASVERAANLPQEASIERAEGSPQKSAEQVPAETPENEAGHSEGSQKFASLVHEESKVIREKVDYLDNRLRRSHISAPEIAELQKEADALSNDVSQLMQLKDKYGKKDGSNSPAASEDNLGSLSREELIKKITDLSNAAKAHEVNTKRWHSARSGFSKRIHELEDRLQSEGMKNKKLEETVDKLKTEFDKRSHNFNATSANIDSLDKVLKERSSALNKLSNENAALLKQLDARRSAMEKMELESKRVSNMISTQKTEITKLKGRLETLEKQNGELSKDLREKTKACQIIERECASYSGKYNESKDLISSLESLVEEKSQLFKDNYMKSKEEKCISTIGGEELKEVLVQVSIEADEDIMRKEKLEDIERRFEEECNSKKELMQHLGNLEADLEISRSNFRDKCTEVDGINSNNQTLQEKLNEKCIRIEALEDEVKVLNSKISNFETNIRNDQLCIDNLRTTNNKLEKEISTIREDLDKYKNISETQNSDLETKENLLASLNQEVKALSSQVARLKEDNDLINEFLNSEYKGKSEERTEHIIEELKNKEIKLREENESLMSELNKSSFSTTNILEQIYNLNSSQNFPLKDIVSPSTNDWPDSTEDDNNISKAYFKDMLVKLSKESVERRKQLSCIIGGMLGFSKNELISFEKLISRG